MKFVAYMALRLSHSFMFFWFHVFLIVYMVAWFVCSCLIL